MKELSEFEEKSKSYYNYGNGNMTQNQKEGNLSASYPQKMKTLILIQKL